MPLMYVLFAFRNNCLNPFCPLYPESFTFLGIFKNERSPSISRRNQSSIEVFAFNKYQCQRFLQVFLLFTLLRHISSPDSSIKSRYHLLRQTEDQKYSSPQNHRYQKHPQEGHSPFYRRSSQSPLYHPHSAFQYIYPSCLRTERYMANAGDHHSILLISFFSSFISIFIYTSEQPAYARSPFTRIQNSCSVSTK